METRSLASMAGGETIRVQRILFETLRSHCRERGVREGAELRIRGEDAAGLELEVGGRAVPCERRYARFIQVTSAAESTPFAEGTRGERADHGA